MKLETLPFDFTVCKVDDIANIKTADNFLFIGKTDEEISVVCLTENVPCKCTERVDRWKGFRIMGNLDFSLVGILSGISGIIAEYGISIFAVSTYNTDYILVKKEYYKPALTALEDRGFEIINSGGTIC